MHVRPALPPPPPRQLVTVAEAAAYIAVTPKTIRRWITTGRITGFHAGPRLIRVDLVEIDKMLRQVLVPEQHHDHEAGA